MIVVKIGGSTLGAHDTTLADLVALQREGREVVVVHGGGAVVTDWLKIHGAGTQFVRGLRVTDAASLDVVVAVLGGLVNKQLVSSLNALGGRAVGLSGSDGPTVIAAIEQPELGRVGAIQTVQTDLIRQLVSGGFLPVISPVGQELGAAGSDPALLNINADTVAGEIAAALGAEYLVFLTDVPGVKGDDGVVRERLTLAESEALIAGGTIGGGMIPKVEACLRAARAGSEARIVDGREPHALLAALRGQLAGSRVG